jgi:hypothetical protein
MAFVVLVIEILLQGFYFATVGDFIFRRALPPIYEADPIRCYRVKADFEYTHRTNEFEFEIHTNSHGLRTGPDHYEYSEEKDPDVYRILITGPSFAFGWGARYEMSYSTLIERGLTIPGKRVEVINLGTPSQGPAHQLCWLKKVGHRYDPDMIFHTSYGSVVTARAATCPEDLSCPAVENGQLVPKSVSTTARIKASAKRLGIVFYGYYVYNALFPPEEPSNVDASKSLHNAPESDSTTDAGLNKIVDSYADYRDYVEDIVGQDTKVAFLYLPYSYQVHHGDVGRFSNVTSEDIPVGERQISAAIDRLHDRGIPILNSMPVLREGAKRERMYYWLDIHLTEPGNRVVAESSIPFLRDLILEGQDAREVVSD